MTRWMWEHEDNFRVATVQIHGPALDPDAVCIRDLLPLSSPGPFARTHSQLPINHPSITFHATIYTLAHSSRRDIGNTPYAPFSRGYTSSASLRCYVQLDVAVFNSTIQLINFWTDHCNPHIPGVSCALGPEYADVFHISHSLACRSSTLT